jgi:hypothetical protein
MASFSLPFVRQHQRGGLDMAPALAQRLDDRRQHQPLDIGARRVVRAERMALGGIEGALQQGAEDGRLDLRPVGLGRLDEQPDLVARQRQHHCGVLEQLAVEARQRCADGDGEFAGVHRPPQLAHQRHELRRIVLQALQQQREGALAVAPRQQLDVLGEHGEQAAAEEAGDGLGVMARAFQRLGHLGQALGHLARDAGGGARRVERERIEPEGGEPLADGRVAQSQSSRMRCERGSGKGV